MSKRPKSIKKYEQELEELKHKAPRAGVHPTKVHKDKSKYTRKKKHKNSDSE